MASVNTKVAHKVPIHTHGGAPTYAVSAEEELCRAVLSCFLWEDTFYESGKSIADRIKGLIPKVNPLRVAQIAIDARSLMKLRHVPLLIAREMARHDTHKHLVSKILPEIIQRADELTEFKESWEKLLINKSMGALAVLRNLRNFVDAGVDEKLVRNALLNMDTSRVLPFRFLAAAQYAPKYEPEIEQAMLKCLEGKPKLPGKTIIIVDVSGSMYGKPVSQKSEMDRAKAACALAALARELCEHVAIYATAGNDHTRVHKTQLVASRRGFALTDAIFNLKDPLGGGGIFLEQVMNYVKDKEGSADRIIVITDEQDCSGNHDAPARADAFGKHNYIINVNTYDRGIGYGKWTHINGWSEAILDDVRGRFQDQGFPDGSDNRAASGGVCIETEEESCQKV